MSEDRCFLCGADKSNNAHASDGYDCMGRQIIHLTAKLERVRKYVEKQMRYENWNGNIILAILDGEEERNNNEN
jgi:hypothetical protein